MAKLFLHSLFVLCSFFLSSLLQAASLPSMKEVHIGIYAPFSGRHAFIGRNILNAMEMASEEKRSPEIHYSFYTLDKLPDAVDSEHTLEQFITVNHLNVLLTEGSAHGLLFAKLARKNNIIHFSMASDPAIADGKNNFLIWSPAYEQASVLVKELQQKNIAHLGIISTNNPSDRILTQSVIKQLQADTTIKVSFFEHYDTNNQNYAALVNTIKDKKAELYLIMAPPKEIESIQKIMHQAQINKPITTIVERVTPKVIKIFNGQWYVDTQEMHPDFIARYQKENLNYPATEAGFAYDAFNLLDHSIQVAMKNKSTFSSQDIALQIHALAAGIGVMGAFNLDNKGVLHTKSAVKMVMNNNIKTA